MFSIAKKTGATDESSAVRYHITVDYKEDILNF